MTKQTTYQIDFTLSEIETLERALMVHQNDIQKYDEEIRDDEQISINTIINKLNKA